MARWGIVWTVFFLGMGLIWASAADPLPSVGQSVDPGCGGSFVDAGCGCTLLGSISRNGCVGGKCCPKPVGDVDGSGTVDILDLAFVAGFNGLRTFPCPDLDYSGMVDLGDAAGFEPHEQSGSSAVCRGN